MSKGLEKVSIVIPTYNEADSIGQLVSYLKENSLGYVREIIVADGGSADETVREARKSGARVLEGVDKGRASQMNTGAKEAEGELLYFLHSDTFPPIGYDEQIVDAVKTGSSWGYFRVRFDLRHWLLSFITYCISCNFTFFRFGDQSLFVRKDVFDQIGGYDPRQVIFEDTEIATRLRRLSKGKKLSEPVVTSARKFRINGVFKMTGIFIYLWMMYHLGVPQERILARYRGLIIQDKI